MSKKIIISESQYKRVFLNEQSSIDDIIVYFNEDKGTIVEQTARLYRLWANSTPELSKKYGKESEFDLDASRKPANSGTFEKSFSKGKSQFDKDWLIVPKENKVLLFTKGGRTKYSVITKKVLPEELSEQDIFLGNEGAIYDDKTYNAGKGSKIKEEIKNIYSSSNTKKSTNVLQKEKESDIEKKLVQFRSTIDFLEDIGLGVSGLLLGKSRLIPYKKNQTFKNAEDIPSNNYLFARTAINAMKYLDYLKAGKTITGVKGSSSVCVTKLGNTCKGSGPYITSDTYTLNLAKVLGNKKIGKYPANYVVYDYGFYYDWDKIVKDLENKFKSDKFAYNSSLFPDGWWSYFTQSYNIGSTGSFNKVVSSINSISSGDIPKIKTLNKYDGGGSIWSNLGDCFSDYHCVLDVASIASLAIPGVGLVLSAGIDFVNAGLYGVEALNAETDEERDAALIAGGLTLFGGFLGGGVGQTKKLLTIGNANPKIYNYVDDVMKTISKELPEVKNLSKSLQNEKIVKIYSNNAEKYGLKESDILIAHDILKDFSKIDPKIAAEYTKVLNSIKGRLSKVQRANLTKVARDSEFQKVVEEIGGDVVKGLNKYMKTKAGKEALIEGGLFVTLTEAMEEPEVQKWVTTKIIDLKVKVNPTIKNIVQSEGYDWESTKELFGSDSSVEDNALLKQAWEKGWRPQKDVSKSWEWLIKNPKYQTNTFKTKYTSTPSKVKVLPKNEEEREEGIKYYETEEQVNMINQPYVDYSEEEENELKNLLKNIK